MSYSTFSRSRSVPNVLNKPTGVKIYPGITSASFTWDKSTADNFQITISGKDNQDKLITKTFNNKDNTFYIHSGLSPGEHYRLTIVAQYHGKSSPAFVTHFQTESLESSPPTSPTSPEKSCTNCADNDDCVAYCPSKTFCINGKCAVCSPGEKITTDSQCYADKKICINKGTGPECTSCFTDEQCIDSYDERYSCNYKKGRCEIPSKTYWSLLIGMLVSIIVLLIIFGIIIFSVTHHKKPMPITHSNIL